MDKHFSYNIANAPSARGKTLNSSKIAFIGAGNMATSLIHGLIQKGVAAKNLWAYDLDEEKLQQLKNDYGINIDLNNSQLAEIADVIVLAVKPQVMHHVAIELRPTLGKTDTLIISIAAGIRIKELTNWLGQQQAIVRCMPNTPALVQTGATALFSSDTVSATQRKLAEELLCAVGICTWLIQESDMDTVTALSGSGPAYFFLLMEAMQESALKLGLDSDTARELTLQTALGAAKLALSSDVSVAELRRRVTSPGGTTEAAVNYFEKGDFRNLVEGALESAAKRSIALAESLAGSDTASTSGTIYH